MQDSSMCLNEVCEVGFRHSDLPLPHPDYVVSGGKVLVAEFLFLKKGVSVDSGRMGFPKKA